MSEKIEGDFQIAIRLLIHQLSMAEDGLYSDLTVKEYATDVLALWDKNRGTDWYTSTLKLEQSQ